MSTLKQYSQIKQDSFGQCLKIGNNLHQWQNNSNRFLELKNAIFLGNHHTCTAWSCSIYITHLYFSSPKGSDKKTRIFYGQARGG